MTRFKRLTGTEAEIGNVMPEYEYIRLREIRQKNCKKGVNEREHGGEQ
jgi:hypothetical protein